MYTNPLLYNPFSLFYASPVFYHIWMSLFNNSKHLMLEICGENYKKRPPEIQKTMAEADRHFHTLEEREV